MAISITPVSVTSSTGITVTQEEAQQFRAEHGNAATYREARAAGFSNTQIANVYGYSTHEVDAYEASLRQAPLKGGESKGHNRNSAVPQGQAQPIYRAVVRSTKNHAQNPINPIHEQGPINPIHEQNPINPIHEQNPQTRIKEIKRRAASDRHVGMETSPSDSAPQDRVKAKTQNRESNRQTVSEINYTPTPEKIVGPLIDTTQQDGVPAGE